MKKFGVLKKAVYTIIIIAVIIICADIVNAESTVVTKDCTDGVVKKFITAKDGLNVRNKPSSTDGKVLGCLSYAEAVDVLLECKNDKDWSIIWYNDGIAYVYNKYLSVEKPEEIKPENLGYKEDLGVWRLIAYEWTGDPCANGNFPSRDYTVASVDLPLGTRIYIDGYGEFTVEDTGAFPSGTIDIYLGDPDECDIFGVQYANVYLVE